MKKYFTYIKVLLFFTTFCHGAASAAEWQWRISLDCVHKETNKSPDAFLWIPSTCEKVNAVIIGKHNMSEETLFEMPRFRASMEELGIALIWITPGIDINWDVTKGTQEVFEKMMSDLAEQSGYQELENAPVVPIGHSAMATYPWNFAAWNPDRTLAIISLHGDAPRTNLCGYGGPNIEWGRTRNIDGIPGLMIMGEYEWMDDRLWPAMAFQMYYPQSTISLLCDVGHGHFDVSESLADYISLFLKKALSYRVKEDGMTRINRKDGWLVQRWQGADKDVVKAPYESFPGCRHEAFWYFDEEMAKATTDYYAKIKGKKDRYINIVQSGRMIEYNPNSHSRIDAKFIPDSDGRTFYLTAKFANSDRTQILDMKENLQIDRICGPVRKVNDSTFIVDFYRMGMDNPRRTNDIWLLAHDEGNEEYKSSVQQLNIKIPYRIKTGKEQILTFPELADIRNEEKTIQLKAKSNLKLPVSYYVKEGPAEINGNRLKLLPIPPKTKFPIKISVVAWQYGIEGIANTAEPIMRTFYIVE